MSKCVALVLGVVVCVVSVKAVPVENTRSFTSPENGLTVLCGEVDLAGPSQWRAVEPPSDSGLLQVFVRPPRELIEKRNESIRDRESGRRTGLDMDGEVAKNLYFACAAYAEGKSGAGPDKWTDIEGMTSRFGFSMGSTSNFHLVSGVKNIKPDMAAIMSDPSRRNPFQSESTVGKKSAGDLAGKESPLIIETRPRNPDGKHWIVYNNGRRERVDIDKAGMEALGVKMGSRSAAAGGKTDAAKIRHAIYALKRAGNDKPAKLELINGASGESAECTWAIGKADEGEQDIMRQWAEARGWRLVGALRNSSSPVLPLWLSRFDELYDVRLPDPAADMTRDRRTRGRDGEQLDMFDVLGGRAALRETLQLQSIDAVMAMATEKDATIPISQVQKLTVKSHPFEEMLRGSKGGALDMANNVPSDRLFVYFAQPSAIVPFIECGEGFVSDFGSAITHSGLNYNLKNRYLERLGISEEWLKLVLRSGAVKEVAITLPDLFLVDGTDFTVISKLANSQAVLPLLKMAGLSNLGKDVSTLKAKGGEAFWALDNDLLVFSTNRKELDGVMALSSRKGEGSLGQSAEFRYMLTQLPVKTESRAYVYFSDPFIRRLVGPEVKIAQFRRLQARAAMEAITAGVLLYRADGHTDVPTPDRLRETKYVASQLGFGGHTIGQDLVVTSQKYGALASMRTLLQTPVANVTQKESELYGRYVSNYSRFWRQFFDPVAMRLDDKPDGGLALTTFILPLIESSIYDGLKGFMATREGGKKLKVPDLTPKPVAMLSLNLGDAGWQTVNSSFIREMSQMLGLKADVFDQMGPGVHLAVCDSDPVITIGSSDLLGLVDGPGFGRGMRGGEMLFIPMILSLLSRPCHLAIELKDPSVVAASFKTLPGSPNQDASFRRGPGIYYYRLEGSDKWVCVVDFFGFAKARLRMEVRDGFLILSNLPWLPEPKIEARSAELNGALLRLSPGASKQQLAGLFTSAMEGERRTAMEGLGFLYPLVAAGFVDPEKALSQHALLFGYQPEHPGTGKWVMEKGILKSTAFGSPGAQVQPQYKEGAKDFGVLKAIDSLSVNMQFEDTGLRTVVEWK